MKRKRRESQEVCQRNLGGWGMDYKEDKEKREKKKQTNKGTISKSKWGVQKYKVQKYNPLCIAWNLD